MGMLRRHTKKTPKNDNKPKGVYLQWSQLQSNVLLLKSLLGLLNCGLCEVKSYKKKNVAIHFFPKFTCNKKSKQQLLDVFFVLIY